MLVVILAFAQSVPLEYGGEVQGYGGGYGKEAIIEYAVSQTELHKLYNWKCLYDLFSLITGSSKIWVQICC